MLTDYVSDFVKAYKPYKGGPWCYEDGCIYRGLELLYKATGDQRWFTPIKEMTDIQIEEGPSLKGYNLSDYNIDNVLSGRTLLFLYETTGDAKYLDTARILIDQLATHPRTKSGVYWHKLRYPWQIWADGLYMGVPFQVGFGKITGDTALIEDGLKQYDLALKALYVPETGLYAHAMDEARQQPWADKTTGHNPAHWTRALGWMAMALVDVADLVGPEAFAPLAERTRKLLSDVAALQQPQGLWLQVIDRPDLDGNYLETSASAMLSYALMKGASLGLYAGPVCELFDQLASYAMQPKADGSLAMVEMCEVAGLGWFEGRFRDGSAEYYLTENRVADDAKGVGPMMMAWAQSIMLDAEKPVPVEA